MKNRIRYTLQLADNALIYGHRLSEWCGHGPVLEQDIALTNISLDFLGQARSLYQHAANMFNNLEVADKKSLFASVTLDEKIDKGLDFTEDDFAYLRDGWDFKNVLLTEQANGDWATTVVRAFYFDTFNHLYYTGLQKSTDPQLAAIAEKSLKEVTYHKRWSSEWMIRLGDGTEESHDKVQEAVNELWAYTGELFSMSDAEQALVSEGVAVDAALLQEQWLHHIGAVLDEATVTMPGQVWMHKGGKTGKHTEHLGYMLTELQFMQRAYPGMEW